MPVHACCVDFCVVFGHRDPTSMNRYQINLTVTIMIHKHTHSHTKGIFKLDGQLRKAHGLWNQTGLDSDLPLALLVMCF